MVLASSDYSVFIVVNLLIVMIGIYFGCCKKIKNVEDYLLGAREMKAVPIGISLISSGISGITILSVPTEIYLYGTQLLYICFGYILASFLATFFYVPVFHKLKITSYFEYLERRFNRKLRLIASVITILQLIFWLPIVLFVPAISINYVTHINIHIITSVFCLICIFYVTLGGFRAIVWSDLLQFFVLFPSILLITIKGSYDIGLEKIIEHGLATNRLESPIFNADPTIRYSFWSLFFGGGIYHMQSGFMSQIMIQKYQSLPNLKDVKLSICVYLLGLVMVTLICGYNGLVLHSYFYGCDPISNQVIKIHDQLLPSMAIDLFKNSPGLSGIFITGISCAALSTVASGINSLAALLFEDFYKPLCKVSDQQSGIILQIISFVIGVGIFLLVSLTEHLGSVFELTLSFDSILGGAIIGVLTIGIFLPWVNDKAVSIGSIAGLLSVGWIYFNSKVYSKFGNAKLETKLLSTEKCITNFSFVHDEFVELLSNSTFEAQTFLYEISFLWYTFIGGFVTIFVSLVTSLCLGWNDLSKVDFELISPHINNLISISKGRKNTNEPKVLRSPEWDLLI